MERMQVLDWVRALAIILVVLFHAGAGVMPGGAVGVSVFFVLSGYLIASILMRDGMMTPGNLARFLVRRIARIYPLYLLDVACAMLFVLWVRPEFTDTVLGALPRLLAFSWYPPAFIGHGFGVLWTLIAEFWFYISFPILLWIALGTRHVLAVFALGVAVSLAAKIAQKHMFTLIYYDHFLIGAAACAALRAGVVPALARHRNTIFVGLGLVLAAAITPYQNVQDARWFAQSLTAAVGAALIIMGAHFNPPSFRLPALAFIGRISYSMYFVHALALDFFPALSANIPVYLGLVVAVSTATYYFIEQPFIRFAHRRTRFVVGQAGDPAKGAVV